MGTIDQYTCSFGQSLHTLLGQTTRLQRGGIGVYGTLLGPLNGCLYLYVVKLLVINTEL